MFNRFAAYRDFREQTKLSFSCATSAYIPLENARRKAIWQKNRNEKWTASSSDRPIIPFIEGDGVGHDIWKNAQAIFDKAVEVAYEGKRHIEWQELLAGRRLMTKQVNGCRKKLWKLFEKV